MNEVELMQRLSSLIDKWIATADKAGLPVQQSSAVTLRRCARELRHELPT